MFELFQPTHLLFVLVVAMVVFGPKRLMEVSRTLGRTLQSFQEVKDEFYEELSRPSSAATKESEQKNKEASSDIKDRED
jgi:sec-independent protein translocase protein TatA